MSEIRRSTWRAALLLAAFAAATTAALTAMFAMTRERIAAEQHRAQQAALMALLPAGGYDNDPSMDRIELLAPEGLGGQSARTIYRARLRGAPVAAVLSVVATDGYAGHIEMLLGVDTQGRVIGVRVTGHQETPGLGDAIEDRKSDWIKRLRGHRIGDPPTSRWAVRRDGGDFDQFAGATVTPRAVVGAIRRALLWYADNQQRVFAAQIPDPAAGPMHSGAATNQDPP